MKRTVAALVGRGGRFMITYVGSPQGFVWNTLLVFRSKIIVNGEMYHNRFY